MDAFPLPFRLLRLWLCWSVLCCALTGCHSLDFIERNDELLAVFWNGGSRKPEQLTDQTWELLRFWELEGAYVKNPSQTLQKAKTIFREQSRTEWAYALAEMSYLEAEQLEQKATGKTLAVGQRQRSPKQAAAEQQIAALYLDAVSYSYYFLFAEETPRTAFDRRNALACAYYNTGLLRCLEWSGRSGKLRPKQGCEFLSWNGTLNCRVRRDGFCWANDDLEELVLAEALTGVAASPGGGGLIRHREEFGLGVPLVGVRLNQGGDTTREKFLGKRHPVAVTAMFHPNLERLTGLVPPHLAGRNFSPDVAGDLMFYDPLHHQSTEIAGQTVPLEMDLGAPLSFILQETSRPSVQLGGFLSPMHVDQYRRLYTFESYQPGKIPIVCVHGLLSGPVTWTETFRELWTDPEIRERYQFWFYLYPTGEPFLTSAAQLRNELQELHDTYGAHDRAYEHMVLVGHSMGGLMSKLQVTYSEDELWKLVSYRDLNDIKTDDQTREHLQQTFFFEPLPFVEQVIFMGTPHLGSKVSRAPIGRLGSWLVRLPSHFRKTQQQLIRDNPDAFTPYLRRGVPTSIDMLASNNPVLETMSRLKFSRTVQLHSVIGTSPEAFGESQFIALLTGGANREPGDSVVPVSSAHIAEANSEVRIPATHGMAHRHALAVQEIRRVLHEQIASLQARYPIDPASGPAPINPFSVKPPLHEPISADPAHTDEDALVPTSAEEADSDAFRVRLEDLPPEELLESIDKSVNVPLTEEPLAVPVADEPAGEEFLEADPETEPEPVLMGE